MAYLETLTRRLSSAVARLPAEQRTRHADYLRRAQNPDGGFSGREGESDLYYTGFALRGLALLGSLEGDAAVRAAAFLRSRLAGQAQIVDFLSLLYGALLLQTTSGVDVFADADPSWPEAVFQTLERLRRQDGGYVKTAEGASSSTYHTFLVVLCQQLIGKETADRQRMIGFVRSRQRDDGGFVEINAARRGGTNPTAAAVALLLILEGMTDDVRERTLDFLVEMQNDEGGLTANGRIPFADLLSTFTGCLTLADLNALDEIDRRRALAYVRSLELPTGGFRGATPDPATDVEYTFYGLGSLALLSGPS